MRVRVRVRLRVRLGLGGGLGLSLGLGLLLGLWSGVRVRVGGLPHACALQVCACAAARARASEGSPTGWWLGRRVPLRVLLHACQELRSAHRRRRPGLARQNVVFEALDSPVEPVLLRLKRPKQPAGAATCAGTGRDGFVSPTCTCRYARLLVRAACQDDCLTHRRSTS